MPPYLSSTLTLILLKTVLVTSLVAQNNSQLPTNTTNLFPPQNEKCASSLNENVLSPESSFVLS